MSMKTASAQLTKYGVMVARKSKGTYRSDSDISITVTEKSVTITFRNGVKDFFGENVVFIQFPKGKALFIVDDENGYKMTDAKTKSDNRYVTAKIDSELFTLLKDRGWHGDYELEYDDNTGWFYIKGVQ